MPKKIPISSLKRLAKDQELTHCILLAHDGKLDHVVTYGKSVEDCSQAAEFGNKLKDVLGWPETLHDQPNRVKILKSENKKLKEDMETLIEQLEYLNKIPWINV